MRRLRSDAWRISEDHFIPNHNRDIYRQQVIDVRRGIDLLAQQPNVDATEISIIGKAIDPSWTTTDPVYMAEPYDGSIRLTKQPDRA